MTGRRRRRRVGRGREGVARVQCAFSRVVFVLSRHSFRLADQLFNVDGVFGLADREGIAVRVDCNGDAGHPRRHLTDLTSNLLLHFRRVQLDAHFFVVVFLRRFRRRACAAVARGHGEGDHRTGVIEREFARRRDLPRARELVRVVVAFAQPVRALAVFRAVQSHQAVLARLHSRAAAPRARLEFFQIVFDLAPWGPVMLPVIPKVLLFIRIDQKLYEIFGDSQVPRCAASPVKKTQCEVMDGIHWVMRRVRAIDERIQKSIPQKSVVDAVAVDDRSHLRAFHLEEPIQACV
eukprot:31340-Pelagococcus_subviridis.AAC.7